MSKPQSSAAEFVRIEAQALLDLAGRIDGAMQPLFGRATAMIAECSTRRGRIIVTGIGKSGLIAQKIAATLNSTGTPAYFLHAAEAIHGDLGMVRGEDLVLALSYSGETEELLRLLDSFKRLSSGLISICGSATSTLARASDIALDASVSAEACSLNLAPTASTTVMLALGDALAMEVSRRNNFRTEDFAALHPGGRLGRRLQRVRELMHAGERIPRVLPSALLPTVIHEMSEKRLGMTTVVDASGGLLGVISDGDLRRLFEHEGGRALGKTAAEVSNHIPRTIHPDERAAAALTIMENSRITSIVVVDADNKVEGVLHLHDLWER
jgi:arabinose-5-phosphate isomerase